MPLALVILFIFLLNVAFGYWRANTRKFSWQWILSIHIPVPIAIGARMLFLGWNWALVPLFVGVFAAGQYSGGKVRRLVSKTPSV